MEREINSKIEGRMETFTGKLDKFFPRIEKQFEDKLIKRLFEVGIHASVKTDKYSLPHQGEIIVNMGNSSYVPDMYDYRGIGRPFLKKLLEEDAYKVRFYIHAETYGGYDEGLLGLVKSGFKYTIRYYIH